MENRIKPMKNMKSAVTIKNRAYKTTILGGETTSTMLRKH